MGVLFSLYGLGIMATAFSIASSKFPSHSTTIHFPKNPVTIPVRKSDDDDSTEQRSLQELVETKVTSVFNDFKPLWWLFK